MKSIDNNDIVLPLVLHIHVQTLIILLLLIFINFIVIADGTATGVALL